MEVRDSHCLLIRHRKGEERKRKKAKCASVCLFMVSLMADFVEDDTTKHIPLCQCKLKQWLEEHTRKHTRKVASG